MSMGIPTCILAIGFVMVPYEHIESQYIKAAIILLFNIGFQFFYMFFYDSYENLVMVLYQTLLSEATQQLLRLLFTLLLLQLQLLLCPWQHLLLQTEALQTSLFTECCIRFSP